MSNPFDAATPAMIECFESNQRYFTSQLGWYERQELTVSGKIYDRIAWYGAYINGYRPPRYQVPATIYNADVATTYRYICGHCPDVNGPCKVCIDEFMDAVEFHEYLE